MGSEMCIRDSRHRCRARGRTGLCHDRQHVANPRRPGAHVSRLRAELGREHTIGRPVVGGPPRRDGLGQAVRAQLGVRWLGRGQRVHRRLSGRRWRRRRRIAVAHLERRRVLWPGGQAAGRRRRVHPPADRHSRVPVRHRPFADLRRRSFERRHPCLSPRVRAQRSDRRDRGAVLSNGGERLHAEPAGVSHPHPWLGRPERPDRRWRRSERDQWSRVQPADRRRDHTCAVDGCPVSPTHSTSPANADLAITAWSPCTDGSVVVFVEVDGASHAWMGHTTGGSGKVGAPYADLDSSLVIWNFLSQHSRG